MAYGTILSLSQCPTSRVELEKIKGVPYVLAVRSIMYVMHYNGPDVSHALSMITRYQQILRDIHLMAMKNILEYLRITNYMSLIYGYMEEDLSVKCYIDASFQTYRDDCNL